MLMELLTSLRIVGASIVLCVIGYGVAVLGSAMLVAPEGRRGQIVTVDGVVVGSRQIAQGFTRAEYVWPRPSAVNYAADAAGGSNLSPANPAIRERAEGILSQLGASAENPAPADLVLASGAGLDPHITYAAALYQAERVAGARGVSADDVRRVISEVSEQAGPGEAARLVNVLMLNIELDRQFPVSLGANNPSAGTTGR